MSTFVRDDFVDAHLINNKIRGVVTGKKRVESLYDFQMICHLHSVTECLQAVT